MQIGDALSFGSYQWSVLAIQKNAALIITEDIIEQRPYHDKYVGITWAECSLRKYLNGEFYGKFSGADKPRIIPVKNKNPDNQWYGTKGGPDTQDSIFLLSLEEAACRYFGDSSSKLYDPGKNQRYWFERKDENKSRRIARPEGKKWVSWWWLRSPGRVPVKAVYIHGDGNIGIQGNNILKGNIGDGKCIGGVRPALWLKLQEKKMNLGKQDELVAIIEKFAGSGRDLINGPAKAWLQKKFESGPAVVQNLMDATAKADVECGSCGCEYDPLYKIVLQSKDLLFTNC